MEKKFNILTATALSLLASTTAHAIQFDGFMTAGTAIHNDDNKNIYQGARGDRGITENLTFETDTRFGLQISSDVADDMAVVAQILGTGVDGNFNAIIEWAYIDYEINDSTSIHVGKIKQPVYLVNDYVEVGYAYPWIRPPGEVYYLNNPLNTVNGIELFLQLPVGPGTLSFQPYIGSNRDDIPNAGTAYFEVENIYGIDIKYSGRGYTAHASKFQCDVTTYGQQTGVPTSSFGPVDIDLAGKGKCDVSAAGFNLDIANFIVYSEWTKRTTTDTLSRAFGDQTAWYTTLGYRIGKWMPHLTIANINGIASTVGISTGTGAVTGSGLPPGASMNFPVAIQSSITAGLRYELNDSAALKVEYQVVSVEDDPALLAGANQGVNYGLFNTDFTKQSPTEDVGILSVALDVIF